jgi:hypothetical protein
MALYLFLLSLTELAGPPDLWREHCMDCCIEVLDYSIVLKFEQLSLGIVNGNSDLLSALILQ